MKIRPSQLPALAKCSAFESGPGSEAAERGTKMHEELKNAFVNFSEYSEEIDYAVQKINSFNFDEIMCEEKLTYLDDDFNQLFDGTPDAIGIDNEKLFIFDLKTGEIRDYYYQMAAYSLMAMQKYNLIECKAYLIYTRWKFSQVIEFNLEQAKEGILNLLDRLKTPVESVCDYCAWCKKNSFCPAHNITEKTAVEKIGRVPSIPDLTTCSDEQMKIVGDIIPIIENWIEKAKKEILERLERNPKRVPGWKIQTRNGTKTISDPVKVFEKLDINTIDYLSCCSVSFPELVKKYKAKTGTTEAKTKEILEIKIAEHIKHGLPSKFIKRG